MNTSSPAYSSTQLAALIRDRLSTLSPQQIELQDDTALHAGHAASGGAGHFRLTITSPHFAGKSLMQRHRMVYDLIGDLMNTGIHALSINTRLPEDNRT
jgi:BolA protein